jgi:hypothetical protein
MRDLTRWAGSCFIKPFLAKILSFNSRVADVPVCSAGGVVYLREVLSGVAWLHGAERNDTKRRVGWQDVARLAGDWLDEGQVERLVDGLQAFRHEGLPPVGQRGAPEDCWDEEPLARAGGNVLRRRGAKGPVRGEPLRALERGAVRMGARHEVARAGASELRSAQGRVPVEAAWIWFHLDYARGDVPLSQVCCCGLVCDCSMFPGADWRRRQAGHD